MFCLYRGTFTEYCFWKIVLKISGLSDEYWSSWDSGEIFTSGMPKLKKKCQEEQIKKNPLSKRKNITNFLKMLNENFILLCRKNSPELSKL